ncbi:dTDP-4-dehydrorhamnose reductase [Aeromonas schubertii]|uniref:dTDP-4-dehydrorhamnose reductase n=1 Tax=Aeromonas schubertii TaxID=652 RepID=UPI001CC626B8|nr:dTDP-4-dehydrorhamnose reductase [Aeromonas schubertii]MBZ6073029.1 dTDP-4-dehydrorhamnose reductase [Aeromonas schubertii]
MVLLGAGQLARAVVLASVQTPHSCIALPRECYPQSEEQPLCAAWLRYHPSVIVNAAAFTDVERAEREPELAWEVNRDGVARLAALAKQHNALLVHFSTDYLFDGCGDRPWREFDDPAPLNVYGHSKWAGEQAIMASGCRYLIIRTSWLHSPWRDNFLNTMLRLAQDRDELQVVCDQIGAPTSAMMLAEVTLQAIERVLAEPELEGLYHVTASGAVSWFDYACFVFKEAKVMELIDLVPKVIPVASHDYPSLVKRPLNSRLDVDHFERTFGLTLPCWQEGVIATLGELSKGRYVTVHRQGFDANKSAGMG